MDCHACGAALSANVRFCHKCGASVGAPAPSGATTDWRAGLPWALAGLAVGALVVVLVLRGGSGGGPGGTGGAAPLANPGAQSTLDISQMSTEEMARRLFDRVMRLSEEGKQDSVAFFLPMALQTYAQLPARDNDARYDIGLLELAGGNPQAALAQADTLLAAVPTHLYALILRARAYDALNDGPNARRAYAGFVQHEATERALGRPEYQAHAATLDAFKPEAIGRARGTP